MHKHSPAIPATRQFSPLTHHGCNTDIQPNTYILQEPPCLASTTASSVRTWRVCLQNKQMRTLDGGGDVHDMAIALDFHKL